MRRRTFLQAGLGTLVAGRLLAADPKRGFDAAADVLTEATASGRVHAAALCVHRGERVRTQVFGTATSPDDMFLIASISKAVSAAAVMTLFDQGKFGLDDPAARFIPEFTGDGRERITVRQLLTHVCGLPDQLPENDALRRRHAPLSEFVEHAVRTPLLFEPGTKYSYSSMGILLAAEVAQRISGVDFLEFVDRVLFRPLEMKRSALGVGRFDIAKLVRCQVEKANPESGAGDPSAKDWDWNSPYWRKMGSPWGTVHASAPDVARFFREFLHPQGRALKAETARLMVRNHNPQGLKPRGLGFDVGAASGGRGCSEKTFGHGGATGTLAWADPETDTVCVVLTTLPARAADPHPRILASNLIAADAR